jgi:hypothetical protein
MTFEEWKKKVDQHVETMIGLSCDDLPDCCYRDWYEDKVDAKAAAKRAIRNAKDS